MLRKLWEKEYAPWVMTALLLTITYWVSLKEIYNIVGGMQ